MSYESPTEAEKKAITKRYRKKWTFWLAMPHIAFQSIAFHFVWHHQRLPMFELLSNTFGHHPIMRENGVFEPSVVYWMLLGDVSQITIGAYIIAWIIGAIIGEVLTWWRLRPIKKGLCIKCQYDLRVHDNQCPECGEFQSVLFKKLQY